MQKGEVCGEGAGLWGAGWALPYLQEECTIQTN